MVQLTKAQEIRLKELGCQIEENNFLDTASREKYFKEKEKAAVAENKAILKSLLENDHMPKLCEMRRTLEEALCKAGFTEVATPTIISKKFLDRMSIDDSHPLSEQVFWLDAKSCLRPMLAPNLYDISRNLLAYAPKPLRIFEIGSCFRKESEGRTHLKEFTMLNLVEWGTPLEERNQRLKEMAELVLHSVGITDFCYEDEESVVYGKGLDVVSPEGLELASTSLGPHPLDYAWKINSSWTGIGFGLERLLLHREKSQGIHRYGKSITYLNGAALNIK